MLHPNLHPHVALTRRTKTRDVWDPPTKAVLCRISGSTWLEKYFHPVFNGLRKGTLYFCFAHVRHAKLHLTLTLLTWTIWRAPTNASKWRMGFN